MRGNDDSMDMRWCAFQGAHYLLQVVYLPTPNCRLWEAHFCQIARHFYVFPWLWFWQCREWVICLQSHQMKVKSALALWFTRSLSQCKIARSDDCIYFSLSFIVVCLLYFETGMTLKPNIRMRIFKLTHWQWGLPFYKASFSLWLSTIIIFLVLNILFYYH